MKLQVLMAVKEGIAQGKKIDFELMKKAGFISLPAREGLSGLQKD